MISPSFKNTRQCFTACGIMQRRNSVPPFPGYRPATSWVHYTTSCNTQSSAPEDGRNHLRKHVELIGIINILLLLHQVSCLYYLKQWNYERKYLCS